jgi:hypothetical protein
MHAIITVIAVIVLSLMTAEPSFAQSRSQTSSYNRCAALASQQGLNAKSTRGRNFISRCMQQGGDYGSSRNCPDDPRTRSAYPAWMCR